MLLEYASLTSNGKYILLVIPYDEIKMEKDTDLNEGLLQF